MTLGEHGETTATVASGWTGAGRTKPASMPALYHGQTAAEFAQGQAAVASLA